MKVLVNALSVNNSSGRHVLLGHLSRLAEWTLGKHEYAVLYHNTNKDICRDLGRNVQYVKCPGYTYAWIKRSLWESLRLPALAARLKADLYFTPAGIACSALSIPQVSFAQNPWALVRGLKRTSIEEVKAFLQKKAYRTAMRKAGLMVFNSNYMRDIYRENAGFREQSSEIVYQGIDDETFEAVNRSQGVPKKDRQVLCVSAMAQHKGVETVVKGIHLTRQKFKTEANLVIVGAWPDNAYEKAIRKLVIQLGLDEAVTVMGHVSCGDLHEAYAKAKIFCLMSHCESFGIPAVEAQAFGTPVISSNCCAIPEVCGEGGVFPLPDDVEAVAYYINRLLTDEKYWEDLALKARRNAERFRWDNCSSGLLKMFDYFS